ncbi:MAG: hypothetical protein ABI210_03925 [Abditibacteriaceae bacterium]
MLSPQINKEGFIDLYDALKLPQNADTERVRERINVLYLKSRHNLDHCNAKKRLRYQHLYEVILPQAWHLLLDQSRRDEYDRYLIAFNSGAGVVAVPELGTHHTAVSEPATDSLGDENLYSESLSQQCEDKWRNWKHGIVQAVDESAVTGGSSHDNSEEMQTELSAPTTSLFTTAGASPDQARYGEAPLRGAESQWVPPKEKLRQDRRRMKIINRIAYDVMMPRGLMVGAVALMISCVVFPSLISYLASIGFLSGSFGEVASAGLPLVAIVIGFFVGRYAALSIRQQIVRKLSRLSLDELKRRSLKTKKKSKYF